MSKRLKGNKKGSLQDLIFIGGILLMLSMSVLFGFKFMSEFNSEIQSRTDIPTIAKTNSNELQAFYPGVVDNSFLILTIGLAIGALVLASLVRISPIFLALFLVALLIVILMCGVLSNIYQELADNAQVSAEADQLIFISTIMELLPFLVGIFGGLLAVIMYKSWRTNN